MKTLKITFVATAACIVAWWLRVPFKVWPSHPMLADFLMSLVLCIVLQAVWTDTKKLGIPVDIESDET